MGNDRLALNVLKQGFNGSVTGGGNSFPEWLVSLTTAVSQGQWAIAETAQQHLEAWSTFRK